MRSAGMYKAWNSWAEIATELRRERRVLSTVTASMRHACAYAAFASWVYMSKGQRRRQDVLRKIVLMMMHAALFKAWNRWLEHAMQVTQLRQNLRKVAARMQHRGLCKSWATWTENVDNAAERRRRRALLEKAAQRMRIAGMNKAWASWRGNCDALCRMNALHMRIVKSMHRRITVVSLFIWLQNSKEQIRMETGCTKIKMRMTSRGIALMLLTWYAHSIELRRHRRLLSTAAARMRYACVYAALASWVDINKGRRRRWDVLRKILNRMISEMFLTWCVHKNYACKILQACIIFVCFICMPIMFMSRWGLGQLAFIGRC